MHPSPFVVGPPEGNPPPPWRVVVGREQTDGMALGEGRLGPGSPGPGRHVHTHEDEGIYVVSGTLTAEVGETRFEVGPQSFLFLPRRVPHVYANLGDVDVWLIGLLNPPGLEDMFREQAAYFASLRGEPDPSFFVDLSARYGIHPVEGPLLA